MNALIIAGQLTGGIAAAVKAPVVAPLTVPGMLIGAWERTCNTFTRLNEDEFNVYNAVVQAVADRVAAAEATVARATMDRVALDQVPEAFEPLGADLQDINGVYERRKEAPPANLDEILKDLVKAKVLKIENKRFTLVG
jgi:hypothetical protein